MSFSSPYRCNVYVASLPPDFTNERLNALFSPFGHIISSTVKHDRTTGACKGYGFVLFETEQHAFNAVVGLQGHSVDRTRIQVRFARPEASAKKLLPVLTQQHATIQTAYTQPVYIVVPAPTVYTN